MLLPITPDNVMPIPTSKPERFFNVRVELDVLLPDEQLQQASRAMQRRSRFFQTGPLLTPLKRFLQQRALCSGFPRSCIRYLMSSVLRSNKPC